MAKKRPRVPEQFDNLGSLITYQRGGQDCCLGYLWHSPEHGVFDPTFGKVPVSPEHAQLHNAELSKALIAGLDTTCEVGQCGLFYYSAEPSPRVQTWDGQPVADCQMRGRKGTFTRGKRRFEFSLRKDDDSINVTRIL